MVCLLVVCIGLVAFLSIARDPVMAQAAGEEKKEKGVGDFAEVTPKLRQAVDNGLDFLANAVMQSPNGGVPSSQYPLAVTALTGLAFLANGETPTRGPHAAALKRCQDYVIGQQDINVSGGIINEPTRSGLMYSHGFATLFLAEVYGTTREPKVGRSLRQAIRLIEQAQSDGGGWTYAPSGSRSRNDMSITVCQTMALRAARNAGIAVSDTVVKKAISCVVQARTEEKDINPKETVLGFMYISGSPPKSDIGKATWPVTCGALCVLYGMGVYKDNGDPDPAKNPGIMIEPALRFVKTQLATLKSGKLPVGNWTYYANYYSVQAMAHAGRAEYWGEWFPALREVLLKQKHPDLPNQFTNSEIDDYYATAMACLILTVPYQYLPTFEP